MANKRMFSKEVIDSDNFLDMPQSSQCLYFHLSMRADDDGFINNPKRILRMIGSSDDDMKILLMKQFILPFENGVIVIKHWKLHNTIQKDRYKPTIYTEEKNSLSLSETGVYSLDTGCIQNGNTDKIRLDKISKDKISKDKKESKSTRHKYGEYSHVLLSDDEYGKLKAEYPNADELIKHLDEYCEMTGKTYKNYLLTIKKWVVDAVSKKPKEEQPKETEIDDLPEHLKNRGK